MNTEIFASKVKPWQKVLPEGALEKPLLKCSIYETVKTNGLKNSNVTAIEYFDKKISYKQMIEKVDQYAACFNEIGVKKGEYVSIISVNIPEVVYTIYGLNKIGAVCNLIDPRTDTEHMIQYVKKGKCKKLVIVDAVLNKVDGHFDEMGLDTIIVQSPFQSITGIEKLFNPTKIDFKKDNRLMPNEKFEKLGLNKTVKQAEYEPNWPAAVTRTGGTTGVAKGVVLSNDCLNAVFQNVVDFGAIWHPGDRLLNFLPIAASYGIACGIHVSFSMSFTTTLVPKFKPSDFADLVLKHKPNHIVGVPIFYETLMLSKKAQKADLSFLTTMVAGGDSASESFETRFNEFALSRGAKFPLAQGYGMSETGSVVSFCMHNTHKAGTVGVSSPHTIISVFEPGTTNEVPVGQTGEVCITGATLMNEYLDEPEETKKVMIKHPDGKVWVHSGDIGVMDDEGFLKIVGRIKRSIIRFDGHKVYPVQLEEICARCEDVKFCSVIPVKDMDHEQGHLPLVVVELMDTIQDKKTRLNEILASIKKSSEERSHPIGIVDVESMPITANGKVNVLELTKKYGHFNYK